VVNSGHASTSIQFKNSCNNAPTSNSVSIACAITGVSTGDTIIANIYAIGQFNGFIVTDTQSNSYTNKVQSVTSSSGGPNTFIFATLSTASSGSLTVTVATGGASRAYAIAILDYSGVSGFDHTGTNQQEGVGTSGTSTVTLAGLAISSVVIDDIMVLAGDGSSVTLTATSGQAIRSTPAGAGTVCGAFSAEIAGCRASDSLSNINSWTWSFVGSTCAAPGCFASHSSLELLGGTITVTTVTQCFGNCGSPAVTLVNTNSTHTVNFNQSLTLFYEFQSNLNGFVNNVTVNFAKNYPNGLQTGLAIYTADCGAGITPFTNQCPGTQKGQKINFVFNKGPNVLFTTGLQVSNGQWIAIAVTASFSGLDLNDTNTNVPIFQQTGYVPATLNGATSFNTSYKLGLWTWITGNIVLPSPPPPLPQACINNDLSCFLVASACGLTPSNCQIGGAIIFTIYFFLFVVGIVIAISYVNREYHTQMHFPPSLLFLFFIISIFVFTAVGLIPQYVTIVIFILTALGVAGYFGSGFMGRSNRE